MSNFTRVREVLQTLAEMPLLTAEELSTIAGIPDRTTRDVLCRLQDSGLIDSVRHAHSETSRAPRWYLSPDGISELAMLRWNGETPEGLLDLFPVSAQWRRYLLRRLDAVGVLYRVARDIANRYDDELTLRWERRGPLDAVLHLPGSRTVGLMRIGTSLSWKSIASRCGTLVNIFNNTRLQAVLMLVPGPIDVQRVRHLMSRYNVDLLISTEVDVLQEPAGSPVWLRHIGGVPLSLDSVLRRVPRLRRRATPRPARHNATMPAAELADDTDDLDVVAGELSLRTRQLLRLLYDFPLMQVSQVEWMLGVSTGHVRREIGLLTRSGLVHRLRIGRTPDERYRNQTRLVLSEDGLRYLSRLDRSRLSDLLKRWSVVPSEGGDEAFHIPRYLIQGKKLRTLVRELRHTDGINEFMTLLMSSCNFSSSWELRQVLPAHRWERRFRHGSTYYGDIWRVIKPDATMILRHDNRDIPFFLEYERRATVPARMEERIRRYRTYYESPDTGNDFADGRPGLLVVFQKREDASRFASFASRSDGPAIPMLTASLEDLETADTEFGPTWLMPWRLDEGSQSLAFWHDQ